VNSISPEKICLAVLRCPGRLRIRPCPEQNTLVHDTALLPGSDVDVWQFSGWWEGIVVSTYSGLSFFFCEAIPVYLIVCKYISQEPFLTEMMFSRT
jgi:hypothetical protein